MKHLHSLLKRQLKRHFGDPEAFPPALRHFLQDINDAYRESDADRTLLERAMELSSDELMQTNREMRAILETFPDLLFRVDADGTILDCKTGNMAKALFSSENLVGKRLPSIPGVELGRKFQAAIECLQETGSLVFLEFSMPALSREEYFEARFVPMTEGEIIVIVRNITERRQAQDRLAEVCNELETRVEERTLELSLVNASLRESEQRLRTILDNVQAGIIVVDPETRAIVDINPAALAMASCSKSEVVGHICHRHLCPAEEGKCPVLDLGSRVDKSERTLLRADGTDLAILKTVVPIFLGGRRVLLESFVDISEGKRIHNELIKAKEEAEKANQAKSEFLANMSHELRTPLHQIIGLTELTMADPRGSLSEKQRRHLGLALQSSDHLLSLINDILDISKVEAGKVSLQFREVDLASLIDDCLAMVGEKALKNHIEISLSIADLPDKIIADDRILRQILYNLLSNAAKFTGEGGSIELSAGRVGWADGRLLTSDGKRLVPPKQASGETGIDIEFIEIAVADNGVGIREEDLERIFNPFEQVESSYARRFDGTGLGLALTREFVELHGGRIWAESRGLGKGSRFRFIIPVAQPQGL